MRRRKLAERWRRLERRWLVVALLISLMMNATLVWFARRHNFFESSEEAAETAAHLPPTSLQARTLTEGEWQKIVDTEAGRSVENPADRARYAGERTQRVDRETQTGRFGSVTGGLKKGSPEQRAEKLGLSGSLGRYSLPADADSKDGQGGDSDTPKGDYEQLDGVAIDNRTLLNTDENVYAGFFNRLRNEVAPRWEPFVTRIVNDPRTRPRPGFYVTSTRFTLDESGTVLSVDIESSSGNFDLDEAARRAIYQLQRVLNPPSFLKASDGLYRITLGFRVDYQKAGFQFQYIPDRRYTR